MNTDDARRVLEAARVKANEIGKPVSVAIVDEHGLMVLFERFGEVRAITAFNAEAKACASAFTGEPSGSLANMQQNPAYAALVAQRVGGRFLPVQGAVPLKRGIQLVGAIGVSGAISEEDEQIAAAGAQSL